MSDFKVITSAGDLSGKRVLLRLDLNIPIENGEVLSDYRFIKSLDTINFLKDQGAKIIILSHIGREKTESLRTVSDYIQDKVSHLFVSDIYSEEAKAAVDSMSNGDIILFENLRQHDGEKENNKDFVSHLASFGDVYVNEAFSNSHRDHASMTGLPKVLPAYAGVRFKEEIEALRKTFNPPNPFLLIVGGAKFETKLPLVSKFTNIANMIFLGGALSNDVYRYKGFNMESSITSDTPLEEIEALLDTGKVIVPADVVTSGREVKDPSRVESDEMVMDAGPNANNILDGLIRNAKLVVWNGPLGFYERGFIESTHKTLQSIVESQAEVIIGGGDIQMAVSKSGIELPERVFVSTGGGAMLDFLSNETLPALEVLR